MLPNTRSISGGATARRWIIAPARKHDMTSSMQSAPARAHPSFQRGCIAIGIDPTTFALFTIVQPTSSHCDHRLMR
jgi:hypothetical protein